MIKTFLLFLTFTSLSFGQKSIDDLKMISERSLDDKDIHNILSFEGIQYKKVKFIGNELKNKSYHLTVKEIWDGEIVSDSTVINIAEFPLKDYRKINDTILELQVVSKLTNDNKLKMTFNFPGLSVPREFNAHNTTDKYSLRNLIEESDLEVVYDKKFPLFAYILPYDRNDGTKSYCDVGSNGMDIENWGRKFGIKHYLIFELKLE